MTSSHKVRYETARYRATRCLCFETKRLPHSRQPQTECFRPGLCSFASFFNYSDFRHSLNSFIFFHFQKKSLSVIGFYVDNFFPGLIAILFHIKLIVARSQILNFKVCLSLKNSV